MKHIRLLFLAASALPALTSCHIHDGHMDFSPVTDRMEDAVEDDVILDGDSKSISAPAPALALNPAPAPEQAATEPAPTPENPFTATEAPAPAPKPIVAAPKQAAPAPATAGALYTVVAGDTLNGVARRSGTTPAALAAANGLTPTSGLRIGQKLRLPGKGAAAAPAKAPAVAARSAAKSPAAKGVRAYTVQPGDTLYRVAAKNGTTPAALMKANGLTPQTAGKIKVGSTLTIPANR